jgi:hypothetical protein
VWGLNQILHVEEICENRCTTRSGAAGPSGPKLRRRPALHEALIAVQAAAPVHIDNGIVLMQRLSIRGLILWLEGYSKLSPITTPTPGSGRYSTILHRCSAAALHGLKLASTASRRTVSSTTTNRHGWLRPTDGERHATSISFSRAPAGNGSRLKRPPHEQVAQARSKRLVEGTQFVHGNEDRCNAAAARRIMTAPTCSSAPRTSPV